MKTFMHILYTWLLAHLMHPLCLMLYFFAKDSESFNIGNSGFFFLFIAVTLLLSIPAMLICWLLLILINRLSFSVQEKYLLWIFCVLITLILNFFGILFSIDGTLNMANAELLIPAGITTIIALLIRVNSFKILQSNYKPNQHENDMV